MVPVIIAVAAITAVAQMYQSEKAAKASKQRLDEIKRMWAGMVPPNFDASITDPPELIRQLPLPPDFNMKKLTPEVFKVVAKYEPQAAQTIKEQAPELIKDSATGTEGRQAQIDALRKFKDISANEGNDPQMMAALQDAAQRSQIESQSRQGSILQDAARRGTMGAGTTLAAQLSGSEQAMSDQAAASRMAAVEAYKNKLAAMREAAGLGGQINQSERQMSGQNADIINAFNQRTSANAQNQANLAANIGNQGLMTNSQNAQDVANKNTGTANEFAQNAQSREDKLLQQQFGNQMQQTQYQNSMAEALANWKDKQKQQQNDLKQHDFNNQSTILSGKTGVQQNYMANDLAHAQAQSNQIQGLGNMATAGAQYYGASQDNAATEDRADARARFEKTGYFTKEEEEAAARKNASNASQWNNSGRMA